ncbi:hypothetical protein EUGRSUZ_E01933 [Eucalyptus grandis]|uniref:Uncharacterized protein n=2 Tax=Eucalyptus grandis TaxID=71139 RepID=A0ACC3KWF4_EUCGR|nr:hypothetical protein EUGRSUZ_E01933 [Eucalyptus grandis]
MEESSSAQSRLIHFIPFLLSSLGSSSSPPIQNASTDKCKIKKKLTKSDLSDHLSRLILPGRLVEAHVLPLMGEAMAGQVKSGGGMKVVMRDADTRDEHKLVFCRWLSSRSYVLKCGWTNLFVKRRGLEVGDEIGIYWDKSKFHFTVHRKVGRGTSNAVA